APRTLARSLHDALPIWVGSVAGVLQRVGPFGSPASETLLLRSGVVGSHLPPLSASARSVNPGDTLILATDGIRRGFAEELVRARSEEHTSELQSRFDLV